MSIFLFVCNNFKHQGVPSLFLQIKDQRYMINVPELTQRFLKENGIKLGKGMKFFLTGSSPDHYGGLLGQTRAVEAGHLGEQHGEVGGVSGHQGNSAERMMGKNWPYDQRPNQLSSEWGWWQPNSIRR